MTKTIRRELLLKIKHDVNWRREMHCSDTGMRIAK